VFIDGQLGRGRRGEVGAGGAGGVRDRGRGTELGRESPYSTKLILLYAGKVTPCNLAARRVCELTFSYIMQEPGASIPSMSSFSLKNETRSTVIVAFR
jgi:hypothetical protein